MRKTIQTSSLLHKNHLCFKQIFTTLILLFLISPSAMSLGIYKWVDEDGKIHYGSQRPKNVEMEKLKLHITETATSPENTDEENNNAGLSDDEKAQLERDSYCKNERKQLKSIEKSKQIHEKNSQGEVRKLSPEARNQRLNKIKSNISKYCR